MDDDAARKAWASIPRPSSALHQGTTAFSEQDGQRILQVVPFAARKDALWLAESLNDSLVNYVTAFAIYHPSSPSEQARWNGKLKALADDCLRAVAPHFVTEHPPGRPVVEVYHTLFHNGEPEDPIGPRLHWLRRRLGAEDSWQAMERITDALWLLRTFAAHAEAQWRERMAASDDRGRRKHRKWLLAWVSDMGRVYASVFGRLPSYSSPEGPFARFAEAARLHALAVREVVTDSNVEGRAYAELAQFNAGRMARFAKAHSTSLRSRWKQGLEKPQDPDRFKLNIRAENGPAKRDGG